MLARLVLLIAVMLMPLGMTPAPAVAHEHSMAGMPMGHCDDGATKHSMKGGFAQCTMTCAAALPAAEVHGDEAAPITCMLLRPVASDVLHGLHPDTATPPPKFT